MELLIGGCGQVHAQAGDPGMKMPSRSCSASTRTPKPPGPLLATVGDHLGRQLSGEAHASKGRAQRWKETSCLVLPLSHYCRKPGPTTPDAGLRSCEPVGSLCGWSRIGLGFLNVSSKSVWHAYSHLQPQN